MVFEDVIGKYISSEKLRKILDGFDRNVFLIVNRRGNLVVFDNDNNVMGYIDLLDEEYHKF